MPPSSTPVSRIRNRERHPEERIAPSHACPARRHRDDHRRDGDVLAFHGDHCVISHREAERASGPRDGLRTTTRAAASSRAPPTSIGQARHWPDCREECTPAGPRSGPYTDEKKADPSSLGVICVPENTIPVLPVVIVHRSRCILEARVGAASDPCLSVENCPVVKRVAIRLKINEDGERVAVVDTVRDFEKAIRQARPPNHRPGRGCRSTGLWRSSTARSGTAPARRKRTAGPTCREPSSNPPVLPLYSSAASGHSADNPPTRDGRKHGPASPDGKATPATRVNHITPLSEGRGSRKGEPLVPV